MGAPRKHNHAKQFKEPTWSFNIQNRPPADTDDVRDEKARLIQEFMSKREKK